MIYYIWSIQLVCHCISAYDFSYILELMLQNHIPYIVEDFLHYAVSLIPYVLLWCAVSFNALLQMWHDILQT